MTSVIQHWVQELSLREQGVLLLALRGPDGTRKEHGAKNIVRALRACVMVPGATGQPLMPGHNLPDDSFMQMYRVGNVNEGPWDDAVREYFRAWDEYNVHFLFHLIHGAQVLGNRYPINEVIQMRWMNLYLRSVDKVHCTPEEEYHMRVRLQNGHHPDSED